MRVHANFAFDVALLLKLVKWKSMTIYRLILHLFNEGFSTP